jgi:hypothetical protein
MRLDTIKNAILGGAVFALLSLSSIPANALLLEASGISAGARQDFTGTIGNRFLVGGSNVTLNALGYEDSGADGLEVSHQVGIWTTGGSLIASATVPSGSTGDLVQVWRFASIPDITLLANTEYYIGASVNVGVDAWTDVPGSSGITYGSEIGSPLGTPVSGFSGAAFGIPNADGVM